MPVILLALGLVGAVAGSYLTAFNPPFDPARFGDTLLIVAMIAIAGGAVLASLVQVNRQLRRIAQALEENPSRTAAALDVPMSGGVSPSLASSTQVPPNPPPELGAALPGPPPRALGAAAESTPGRGPQLEPPHPAVLATPAGEAPASQPGPRQQEPESSAFDALWSTGSRDANGPHRPQDDHPAAAPPASDAVAAERHADERGLAKTASNDGGAVKIFKSGVIDGMAYTLYTDGSIEAELPQGTVRFATVEELRIYLEGA
jgi:hypothetical protein